MFMIAQCALSGDGDQCAEVDTSALEVPRERGPETVSGGSATKQDRYRV